MRNYVQSHRMGGILSKVLTVILRRIDQKNAVLPVYL